jgi:hypothetical protein
MSIGRMFSHFRLNGNDKLVLKFIAAKCNVELVHLSVIGYPHIAWGMTLQEENLLIWTFFSTPTFNATLQGSYTN